MPAPLPVAACAAAFYRSHSNLGQTLAKPWPTLVQTLAKCWSNVTLASAMQGQGPPFLECGLAPCGRPNPQAMVKF